MSGASSRVLVDRSATPVEAVAAGQGELTAIAPESHRYVLLDGLRGLAALAIVIHHFTSNSGHREFLASSAIAVEFFFCVGGFVIAAAHEAPLLAGMPFASYARRRLERIYPLYAVGAVLGIFVICLLKFQGFTDMRWGDIWNAVALNSVLLPYLNDRIVVVVATPLQGTIFPFNNPAWSLFFLLLANSLYAVTLKAWRAAPIAWMVVAGAGLVIATISYGEAPGWGTANFIGGFPRVLFSFFAGVVVYRIHRHVSLHIPALALAILAISLFAVGRFPGHRYFWLTAAIVIIPTLVLVASRATLERDSLGYRLCLYAGRLSYPVYCIHYPLLMLVPVVAAPDASFPLLLGSFVAITFVVANIAMRLVEDPLRAYLARQRRAR